jgi:hypothetical protein
VGAVLVGGCGDRSPAQPDAPAAIDAPPASDVVSVTVEGTDVLVAYRDGQGPWIVPNRAANGDYLLQVTADYQLVLVCADHDGFDAELYRATLAERPHIHSVCIRNVMIPPDFNVTGQMKQSGWVYMTNHDNGSTSPWMFSITTEPGTHDLLAYDDTSVLIRRDLSIPAATTLAMVDLAQGGAPLGHIPVTVTNAAADDTIATDVELQMAHDTAYIDGTATAFHVPPDSLVRASDVTRALVFAYSSRAFRSVYAPVPTSHASYTLMPVLDATFTTITGTIAATWTSLPPKDELRLDVGTSTSSQMVTATAGYLAAHPTSQLVFDASPPGWNAAWQLDLSTYWTELTATWANSGNDYMSRISASH